MTRELIVRRVILALALIAATVIACRDISHPLAPHTGAGKVVARTRHGVPIPYTIQCYGRRSKRTFSCRQAVPKLAGREKFMPQVKSPQLTSQRVTSPQVTNQPLTRAKTASTRTQRVLPKDVVIGGTQGQYVTLATADYAFDTISNIFSLDATVQNDLGEPLGTPDGSTVTGIKVFVSQLYVTSGSGTVSIANADSTGTFTAANQPYWLYNQMLAPTQVSNSRNWQIYLAPTVDGFYLAIETYAAFPAEYTTPATAPDTTVDSIYARSNITNVDPNYGIPHLYNVVTVDFARDTSSDDRELAVAAVGGTVVGGWDYINNDGFYLIGIPGDSTGAGLATAISTLESLPQVANASPEFILDTNIAEYRRPNDHFQPSSWNWNPDYPSTDTLWAFSHVEAPLAWGCDTGSTTTQVAVVDLNFPQIPDLDTNGVSVFWTPFTSIISDHGVAMASIVAAQGNNGIGIAGMMWRARLRLYDAVDVGGEISYTRDISLFARAAEDGARAINISLNAGFGQLYVFGQRGDSSDVNDVAATNAQIADLDTAMLRADSASPQQPVYVVAGGDESTSSINTNPWWNVYPTLKTLFPGRVLVVEWTDSQDKRAPTANALQYVNIAAPGDSVAALEVDGSIGLVNGSSPSAALVTGTVGLLFAFDSSMSSTAAVNYIIQGAINGGRQTNDPTPLPILNAYAALQLVAAQPGQPLCNNRLWSSGGYIYAARGSGSEAIASTGGSPAWNVTAMHGGHRFEFNTVHGRYSVQYTSGVWGTPVLVEDSLAALGQAPFNGPGAGGGYFNSSPLVPGDTVASDSIIGGTAQSIWGYNHDGDSAIAAIQLPNTGSGGLDSVIVVRGPSSNVLAGTGQLDTVGVATYASADTIDYGCDIYEYSVCIQNFVQPTRVDFVRVAYAPRGDRVLLAIDHDTVNVVLNGYYTISPYQLLMSTIDIKSWTVDAYSYSLPSKQRSTLTIPSGDDVWWWGISEADSTIVAGLGIRDLRLVADSANGEPSQTITDYTTSCSVDFRSLSFALFQTVATTDACSSAFSGGPAIYGSGSISPNRAVHAPPKIAVKSSRSSVHAKPAAAANPHP
jgi:Subtilase family